MRLLQALAALLATASAFTPLFSAVASDDAEKVQAALANGADINQINSGGQTPLRSAALGVRHRFDPKLSRQ